MKRRLRTVPACVLAGGIFVSWSYFHTVQQAKQDDRLIAAIKDNAQDRAEAALRAGANGNASERSAQKPLTLLAQVKRLFIPHSHAPAPSGDTALLVYLLGPYRHIPAGKGEFIVRDPYTKQPDDPEFVHMLLDARADIHAVRSDAQTALHIATKRELPQTMRLLLARGADPSAQDSYGHTPLHLAAVSYRQELLQILLDGGAKPDSSPEMQEMHGLIALLRNAGAKTGKELDSISAGVRKAGGRHP